MQSLSFEWIKLQVAGSRFFSLACWLCLSSLTIFMRWKTNVRSFPFCECSLCPWIWCQVTEAWRSMLFWKVALCTTWQKCQGPADPPLLLKTSTTSSVFLGFLANSLKPKHWTICMWPVHCAHMCTFRSVTTWAFAFRCIDDITNVISTYICRPRTWHADYHMLCDLRVASIVWTSWGYTFQRCDQAVTLLNLGWFSLNDHTNI